MRFVVALWRLLCSFWQLALGILTCSFIFPFLEPPQRLPWVSRWSVRVLRALGVALSRRVA